MQKPIGIFDSGIGGTSIWKEVINVLPNESTIYLADSLNAPYGEKSKVEIIEFSIKNTELLLSKGCKLIIVACNTATTNAIKVLREKYNVPFIGIEPAIKPAAFQTVSNRIGILATKGTLSSELFSQTSIQFASNIKVIEQIGSGLVELIENGELKSEKTTFLLQKYLKPMISNKIDYLVLGCTHYPYLIPQIRKIIGNDVKIIDSGLAVAKQTKAVLEKNKMLNNKTKSSHHFFYTNSEIKTLEQLLIKVNVNFSVEKIFF